MILLQADIIPSVSEAFTSGTLVMPTDVVPGAASALTRWGDIPVNGWMIVLSAIFMMVDVSGLYYVLPDLSKCVTRWRWNLTADASMKFSRERDILALLAVLPVTVIASRFGMIDPEFLGSVPQSWRTLAVLGIVVSYLILRLLAYVSMRHRARRVSNYQAAHTATRNIFIVFALVLMLTVGILWMCGADDAGIRLAGIMEASVFYVIALWQKSQILGASCNPLSTFLYLCALEFLPTGLLIALNVCL